VPINVSEPILVATAHLFWHPEYADVKLIQTMLLTHELRRIMATVPVHLRPLNSTEQQIPMILAGDFNALPDSGINCQQMSRTKNAEWPLFTTVAYTLRFGTAAFNEKFDGNGLS
jgi:mRNA deadenylase 3'-5' endonuclease subunit Ccr4